MSARAPKLGLVVALALLVLGSPARSQPEPTSAAAAATAPTRYTLQGGCYGLRTGSGAQVAPSDGPFRMQAAALGEYLLYGAHQNYLGPGFAAVNSPSDSTVWRVDGDSRSGFTLTNLANHASTPVSFTAASGCAVYPEAQVDASGAPFTGASPEANALGTVESHAHVTAFEFIGGDFHCGRPWSPFGAPYALPADCSPYEVGANGAFESFLDFGGPSRPSDMHGWPTFKEWPSPTALVEEGDYYTGIERAWKAGLRIFVTQLVDNEALCSIMTKAHNPCNDMAAVHIQSRDLYALQDYIDAQSGGPGKGWFRIVTDPFQARQVINEGKLAVIEGIEVSRIFGCGESHDVPQCDRAQVDAGLKEVHALGVRTFFPVHEFDNAFGGTKGIAGDTGAIVNAGNEKETGSFWTMQPCPPYDQDAEQTTVPGSGPLAQLLNGPLSSLAHGNPTPVYGPGPQCNTRGLTDLGGYVVGQMIKQHFVIQTDHMSSKAATAAVAIAEAKHYSGVVSAHCCSSPQLFKRIYATGGAVNPPVMPATAFVAAWKADRALRSSKYHFGFGWGSDENGLGGQPGPSAGTPISYPFTSFDGRVTFTREQWGQRTFDLNKDGLANYGMYADWLRDVQLVGGRSVMDDMFQGAEGYLQMWERAYGVHATNCRSSEGNFTVTGTKHLRLGASYQSLLYSLGQPSSRPGRSYRYCVDRSPGASIAAVFNTAGKAVLFTSTAGGYGGAVGIHPGSSQRRLTHHASRMTRNLWLGPRLRGGARILYGVRAGRVRFVGVGAGSEVRSRSTLAADLRQAGVA